MQDIWIWIPRLGRFPGVGNGSPLLYPSLENSMDNVSLAGYSPWGRKESDVTEQSCTIKIQQFLYLQTIFLFTKQMKRQKINTTISENQIKLNSWYFFFLSMITWSCPSEYFLCIFIVTLSICLFWLLSIIVLELNDYLSYSPGKL